MRQLQASSTAETRGLQMLRAVGSPVRLRIAELLADRKDCTAPQLAAELKLAQSSLFEHLATMREVGIVQASGDGPHRSYCLDPAALEFLAAYIGGLGDRARSWTDVVSNARERDGMDIRTATIDDAAAIARIYNQGIEDRMATLETLPRTPEERAEWIGARGPRHPVLVAVDAGGVLGWGSLNQYNPRPAYDHVVDFSVYVGRECRGRGIGDALLGALEERARALGFHKMVLAAFPGNAPGMRLYERHGFAKVGIFHEQGMLDGKWVDVIVMEKLLS